VTSETAAVEFRILGEVEARVDGRVLHLGGRRQRSLLALLLLEPGKSASSDRLTHELWAGDPPRGADVTLRSYASKLRAVLGTAASVHGSSAGYTLQIDPLVVDAVRFERLLEAGERDLERGAFRGAARSLRDGLSLWHGEPFGGLADGGALRSAALRLEELRVRAVEKRIEAELELGESTRLVEELEALVAEHPLRERLWRHLMLALYRAGRQADALEAYQRVRRALDEELGLEPGGELERLQGDILRHEVRAARPPEERHNLPAAVSSFVGRTRELAEVSRHIGQNRLVTLTGVGGVGKTRLALEAAQQAVDDTPGGVWFVDLAPIADPGLVPAAIAAAMSSVDLVPGADAFDQIAALLGQTDTLLVLDNCEHLIDATAEAAAALLRAVPRMRILATSREPLGLPGEVDSPVPPLARGRPGNAEQLRESDAVRLFLERARAARPDLREDDETIALAARICEELDGLPLALELAAAHAKSVSLTEIASRLADRFRFLAAWRRLTPARHRTLREAIDWSYDLLTPEEQRVFDRLAVFSGGFTLDAVAAVCLADPEGDAFGVVARLVRASLVEAVAVHGSTRYRLLETIRQYASDRLTAAGVPDTTLRLHAEHYRRVADAANLGADGGGVQRRFGLIREELPNIRAALRWCLGHDSILGLQVACALEQFWVTNASREGIATFEALLETPNVPTPLRAQALRCLSGCVMYSGDFALGEPILDQSLALYRELGDDEAVGHLLLRKAIAANQRGEDSTAAMLLEESRQRSGPNRSVTDVADGLVLQADIAFEGGQTDEAMALLEESRDLAHGNGDRWFEVRASSRLARYSLRRDRPADALEHGRAALAVADEVGDRQSIVFLLATLASAAAASGELAQAGRLWGAIEGEVARGGPVGQWDDQRASYERRVLNESEEFELARMAGRALSLEDAIQAAVTPPRA